MAKLKAWARREVLVMVPTGFDKPQGKPEGDPRFLRQMAESMKPALVVYENMASMYRRRVEFLESPIPNTTRAEREAHEWRMHDANVEARLLRTLLSAPATCAKALNDIANRKTAVQADEYGNWTLEGPKQ